MLCVYPYCLSNFTRNEREAGVGLSRARAISLESGGSLFTFVGRHGGSIVFLFLHPLSLEKEMKIFARALRGLLNSLYLSHPTSLFGFSILLCTIYYSSVIVVTPMIVLIPMLGVELSKTRYLFRYFFFSNIDIPIPTIRLPTFIPLPFSKWGTHVRGNKYYWILKEFKFFEFSLISVQWRETFSRNYWRTKKGCVRGEGEEREVGRG